MTAAADCSRWQVGVDYHFAVASAEGDARWRALAACGDTNTVFQQPYWQRTWWEVHGRGELAVVSVVDDDGRVVAVAPLFIDGAMAFLVGSGGSDYLDFIGDAARPGVVEAIVGAVFSRFPGLLGLRLYHVPDASRTGARLQQAAGALGLACHDEGDLAAPALALGADGDAGRQAAARTSLRRHERACAAAGTLTVEHLRGAEQIVPRLDAFFDQHRRRWRDTAFPSLFDDAAQRHFYRRLAEGADADFGLRFTVVAVDGRPWACHYGFTFGGSYLWYKPSFEIEFARHSPGEVLLRQLLLAAVDEQAQVFDFGLGDEAFKHRFADRCPRVRNWGVYPVTEPSR